MPGMFETEGLTLDGLVIDGDVPQYDLPYFVPGTGPAPPEPLADTIAFMIGLPEGVAINEFVVRPTGQLNPYEHAAAHGLRAAAPAARGRAPSGRPECNDSQPFQMPSKYGPGWPALA